MPLRVISFLIVSLTFCASIFAQASSPSGQWNQFQTKHFKVLGNTEPERLRAVSIRLEQFRSAVHKELDVPSSTSVESRVVIFRDGASFRNFKPKRADGTPDDLVSGLFQSGTDVNYISAADDGAETATIFHEYIHDVLARNFAGNEIPAWINEGLAEYFQGFRMRDSGVEFGLPHRAHLSMLRRRTPIPWAKFFLFDDETLRQSSDQDRLLFYAQAWAMIHHLISTSDTPTISPSKLARRADDSSSQSLDSAIAGVLSTTEFRTRTSVTASVAKIDEPVRSQLSVADMNAYLGDLSFRMREFTAAEAYLKVALSLEPRSAIANASLGLMRMSQRKFAEAKVLFENAAATDTRNFLVHFYSAFLINRENTDNFGMVAKLPPADALRMRSLLRRSIDLNPNHSESYKLLAFVSLVNGDDLDAALTAIQRAIALQSGNQEYRLIAAQLLVRLGRSREAAAAATQILSSTKDRFLASEAEEVLHAANEYLRTEPSESGARSGRKPVFLKRRDLTDEEIAKIERDRENNNLNRLIDRPGPAERQEVGRIEKLTCSRDGVGYRFRGPNGVVNLTGKDFDDLNVKVLLNGAHSFTFGCDVSLTSVLVVAIYSSGNGLLRSLAFVPDQFRLKTIDELAREPLIIIEGMTPSDLALNAKTSEAEQAEFDRQMRDTQARNVELRLRSPERGDSRLIATPVDLTCTDGRYTLTAKAGSFQRTFSSLISSGFFLNSLSPETGLLEIGCRSPLPPLPAVITYRPVAGRDELVALEFVPRSFKLP